jgi:hypothetical protein
MSGPADFLFQHRDVHVRPRGEVWCVKRECSQGGPRVFPTRADALVVAKAMAHPEGRNVVVHGHDGLVLEVLSPAS